MPVIATIIMILLCGMLLVAVGMIIWLSIDIYFSRFKIEKHPVLVAMVEKALHDITSREKIHVFNKSFEDINVDKVDRDKWALGMYIHINSKRQQKRAAKTLVEILALETEHNMSYRELAKLNGHETEITAEDFMFPKILLAQDKLMKWGLIDYYGTYFHEIGHHFAVKTVGNNHTELDANQCGHQIILENLPYFFQSFSEFNYEYRANMKKLSRGEKLKAYCGYLVYYIKNRKTIIKKWQKNS